MRVIVVAVAFSVAVLTQAAHAGRSCEERKPDARAIGRGLALAERTHRALEAEHAKSGTNAVFLARAGQDLTKYGLRYSHMGIAYRTQDAHGRNVWRVLHKLNHCGTAESALYRQGLGEFFLDGLWRYEAAWSVPSRELQDGLMTLVRDERRATSLQHKPYSIVSYVWGRRYQQSNQWMIETLAMAADPSIATRAQAQAWLQSQGYQPTMLRLGPLTRLGGRMSAANVAFDDHPDAKRFSDRIETVTVDSVFHWLQRSGMAAPPAVVRGD